MDDKKLTIVKESEIIKLLFHKLDAIIDNCYRDCHNKYYHTFEYECEDDNKPKKIRINENVNLTIVDKSMSLFELNKKITVARQNGLTFNQTNKLTKFIVIFEV